MVIALKNDDLEVKFKTFGGIVLHSSKEGIEYLLARGSRVLVRTSASSVSDLRERS